MDAPNKQAIIDSGLAPEGYDLDPAAGSKLGNISTRTLVQTGDNVMIGGFIASGSGTIK
jgi:hypothetical protein